MAGPVCRRRGSDCPVARTFTFVPPMSTDRMDFGGRFGPGFGLSLRRFIARTWGGALYGNASFTPNGRIRRRQAECHPVVSSPAWRPIAIKSSWHVARIYFVV